MGNSPVLRDRVCAGGGRWRGNDGRKRREGGLGNITYSIVYAFGVNQLLNVTVSTQGFVVQIGVEFETPFLSLGISLFPSFPFSIFHNFIISF